MYNNSIYPSQSPPDAIQGIGNVTVTPMVGGMISNVGDFIKKNAVVIGLGAIGIGAVIYFMTRKENKSKGLSGATYRRRRATSRSRTPKRLTAKKLS